ncbi:ribonuclease [Novosphingobium sp. JCM 18896]|uniref:ribonuclease n=1 Tax=Novosphingobium sp. JCM 18896 TaxID=2989731 RepID=UPI002221E18D|nr:ribonuclease [Novosphingobium sp. JCM 18896]MCW1427840.1 ribonuclease [Novosphingobium sp. JCM 18896]
MPRNAGPEWLIEEGIGEHRAILTENGAIRAARIDWPGPLAAGQVEDAVLIARTAGAKRGLLRFASGEEALVDQLPREASEGAPLRAVITRAAIAETGRLKRAQARPTTQPPRPAPTLAERLRSEGETARVVRRFEADLSADWDALFAEAWSGEIAFAGGSLTISPTPAMTLIDVDGTLPLHALALAAIPAVADAIRRFDLAGSIGIDFPTLSDKADRRAVDEGLATALADWRHERTAINGFGFVQLVARLERPSLLHRLARDRTGAAARLLLRRAERIDGAGALLVAAHPGVLAAVRPDWRDNLARRSGKQIRWQPEPALALDGGYAQLVDL